MEPMQQLSILRDRFAPDNTGAGKKVRHKQDGQGFGQCHLAHLRHCK